jgi:hypothetical protein
MGGAVGRKKSFGVKIIFYSPQTSEVPDALIPEKSSSWRP